MIALPEVVSRKFRFWSFASIILVVLMHSYNLQIRYLQPWTNPEERMSVTAFTEYFISNGIFRFTMPMLFMISGFLYAANDALPNKLRINKRFKSLIIPYLIWAAIGMLMVYVMELIPFFKTQILATHIAQMSDKTMLLHQYKWYEVLLRFIFAPLSYQLWFIRVLFIYNLAYIPIRYCVMHPKGKWIFFVTVTCMWIFMIDLGVIEGEGLLFFALGVWLQKNQFDMEKPKPYLNPFYWGLACIAITIIRTWLAFKGLPILHDAVYPIIAISLRISVFCGLVAAWFGFDRFINFMMKQRWFTNTGKYAFFIYLAHAPLVALLIDPLFSALHYCYGYRIISLILLPILLIAGFSALAYLIKLISPKVYGIISGGRGL